MTRKIKILCIGDSHTAGFPQFDPHFGGIPESTYEFWLEVALQKNFPKLIVELDNEGVCGEFSSDIYHRLLAISNLTQYTCVLFWGGANDLGMGRNPKDIWYTIEGAHQYCNSIQVPCFLFTIPPMNIIGLEKQVLQLNQFIQTHVTDHVVDVYPKLEQDGKLKAEFGVGDGVHLSIQGYKTVAEVAYHILCDFLPKEIS